MSRPELARMVLPRLACVNGMIGQSAESVGFEAKVVLWSEASCRSCPLPQ